MTVLLIDAGNSRLKWRVADLARGLSEDDAQGSVASDALDSLARAWDRLAISQAWAANVAGMALGARVGALVAASAPQAKLQFLRSLASQGGVTNGYHAPETLGADRWAALIGARALHPGEELVIASFGTATTLDHLTEQGVFDGGVILPGLELMRESLSSGTAGLPLANGQYLPLARQTQDAITSGVAHAQAGALERLMRILSDSPGGAARPRRILLTGGAAGMILPLLPFPATIVDNLVLRGLFEVARDPRSQRKPE